MNHGETYSGKIRDLFHDLRIIFGLDEIRDEDMKHLSDQLLTNEAVKFLNDIREGSKPESALRDSFFAEGKILGDILFREAQPEVNIEAGYIDYCIRMDAGRQIILELRPLFERNEGKISQKNLTWKSCRENIFRYMIPEGTRFIIITDLKDWFFFSSKDCISEDSILPFHFSDLFDFYEEFKIEEEISGYLRKKESKVSKEELVKQFFNSLKIWENKLSEIQFNIKEEEKRKLIIHLINKFIFIQTLDDFGTIDFNWIIDNWRKYEGKYLRKGHQAFLREFLREVNELIHLYIDAELFKGQMLELMENNNSNFKRLYDNLRFVLGLESWQFSFQGSKGIIQYDYENIDEDIFGIAYETFLAKIRKEKGIYYTPKYVTQYIVENTVGSAYDSLMKEIDENLEARQFDHCRELLDKFVSMKILDPSCGSGPFLIKSLREVWKKYCKLYDKLKYEEKKYSKFEEGLLRREEEENLLRIGNLRKILEFEDRRSAISRIIVRHIHGNDSDSNAVEVAKVNLWLEAIKLIPYEFRHDKLPANMKHILPNLEMNFGRGNSLVGLPEDETVRFLQVYFGDDLRKLFKLRKNYLEDPSEEASIIMINTIKSKLKNELEKKFKEFLEENTFSLEIIEKIDPFYWALDFWHVFFYEDVQIKEKENWGFDFIIGNPPYISLALGKRQKFFTKEELEYFRKVYPDSSEYKGNTYCLFIDKFSSLCRKNGLLSFIVPNTLLLNLTAENIRKKILDNFNIKILLNIKTKVFESAEIGGNLVFVFKKGKVKSNKTSVAEIRDIQDIMSRNLDFNIIGQDYFESENHKFYTDIETMYIVKKMSKGSLRLGEIVDFYQGIVTGDNKKFLSNEKLNEKYQPIIRGRDINRYSLNFSNTFVLFEKEMLWSNTDESYFLIDEKLINRQTGDKLVATYDNCRYFTLDSTHVQILKLKGFSLKFILGIFNSKLMNFYYEKIVQEEDRPFAQVKTVILKKLPVRDVPMERQQQIIHFVDEILVYRNLQNELRKLWIYCSRKYRNRVKSLGEILIEDKRAMQRGNLRNIWTSRASIYPDESNEILEEEFQGFRIRGRDETELEIYGIKKREEKMLLKITARKKELRDILYLELMELLDSRTRIETLKEIFSKSNVSVIQPNIWENTGNLIKICKGQFDEWLKEHNLNQKESDIIRIDSKIQELENLIDACVFSLYQLTKKEVELVLDSQNTLDSIKTDIIAKL